MLTGRKDFRAQTPVCSCLVWSRADACSGTLAAPSRGRDMVILVTAARAWPGGIPHAAGVGMWGGADQGFCDVTVHTCPPAPSELSGCACSPFPQPWAAPVQLHWAGYSQAPAITYFGINCNVDNLYPTSPCLSLRSSCILGVTLRFPLCSRGTMRGLFLAPPLPRAATMHGSPVSVCTDGAWC